MGLPKGRESYGNGVPVVVSGVTTRSIDLEGYSFILLPGCFPTVTLVTGLEKFYPHFHSPR